MPVPVFHHDGPTPCRGVAVLARRYLSRRDPYDLPAQFRHMGGRPFDPHAGPLICDSCGTPFTTRDVWFQVFNEAVLPRCVPLTDPVVTAN